MNNNIDGYQIHYNKIIGQGAFASIYECQKDGILEPICVKILKLDNFHCQLFQNEKQILQTLQKLDNPNLIKIFHISQQNQNIYIFMQKYKYNLRQWVEKKKSLKEHFPVQEIMRMIHQIVNGFKSLYNNHIIHRDLKPENILVGEDGQLKISDFGLGKILESLEVPIKQTMLGTPFYSSPQCLDDGIYSSKTDIFSLGMIIYYITFQSNLFQVSSIFELLKKLETLRNSFVKIPKIINEGIPEQIAELEDFFQLTITYEEATRIDWPTLFEWFTEERNIYQDQLLITQQFCQLRRDQIAAQDEYLSCIKFDDSDDDQQIREDDQKQKKDDKNLRLQKKNQNQLIILYRFIQKKIQFASSTMITLTKIQQRLNNSEVLNLKYLILSYKYQLLFNLQQLIEGNTVQVQSSLIAYVQFPNDLIEDQQKDIQAKEVKDLKWELQTDLQKLEDEINKEIYQQVLHRFKETKLSLLNCYEEIIISILKRLSTQVNKDDTHMIRYFKFQSSFMAYSLKFSKIDINYPISNFRQQDLEEISTLTDDQNELVKFIELNNIFLFK